MHWNTVKAISALSGNDYGDLKIEYQESPAGDLGRVVTHDKAKAPTTPANARSLFNAIVRRWHHTVRGEEPPTSHTF